MKDKPIKLLMIEDDPIFARSVKRLMFQDGILRFDWRLAATLDAGLEQLARERFEVILLDLGLPDSNGLETLSRTYSKAAGVPIIVLTGMYDEEMAVRAFDLGAADFLQKTDADGMSIRRAIRYAIERAKVEFALKQSEMKFRDLYDSAPNAFFSVGIDGLINMCNKSAGRLLGCDPEDLVGKPVFSLYTDTPQGKAKAKKTFEQFKNTGMVNGEELQMQRVDGTPFWVSLTVNAVRNKNGEIVESRSIANDITERKRTEEHLLAYQKRLKELAMNMSRVEDLERRRIATELHANVGQTLAAANMKLGLIARQASQPDLVESIEELRRLWDQVVDYARSLISELSPAVLNELGLVPALEWLSERHGELTGFKVEFEDDGKPKPVEENVKSMLFQATRELLVNAAKHSQVREARVFISREDDDLRIVVEDIGVGFEPSKIDSTAGGFGLFNLRERIGDVGGRIEIASAPDRGTKITLVTPLDLGAVSGNA